MEIYSGITKQVKKVLNDNLAYNGAVLYDSGYSFITFIDSNLIYENLALGI